MICIFTRGSHCSELNKVYTNGTLVDADLLIDDEAGHCVSIREDAEGDTYGICVLDSSTSQFDLSAFVDDVCRTKLETIMRQLRPKEILFTKVCNRLEFNTLGVSI
jgi:DNA mismatch repair protein MSH6